MGENLARTIDGTVYCRGNPVDEMNPVEKQMECRFYEPSELPHAAGLCKWSFDGEGWATDECLRRKEGER